jgi:hypothetical protein
MGASSEAIVSRPVITGLEAAIDAPPFGKSIYALALLAVKRILKTRIRYRCRDAARSTVDAIRIQKENPGCVMQPGS